MLPSEHLPAGDVHVHIHFDHAALPAALPPRARSPHDSRAQPREPASPGAVFSRVSSPASTSPPRGPRMAAAPPTLPLQPMARLIAFDDSLADLVSEVESLSHAAPPAWPQHSATVPSPPEVVQQEWEHFQERSSSSGGACPLGGSLSARRPGAQPYHAVRVHNSPPLQCEEKRAGSCRRRQGLAVRTHARAQPAPASAKTKAAASPTSLRSSPPQSSHRSFDARADWARAGPFPAAPHARLCCQDTLPLAEKRRSPIQRVHIGEAGHWDRQSNDTRARPCADGSAGGGQGQMADSDGVLLAHAALQAGCAAHSRSPDAVCAGDEEDELLRFLNDSM